LHAVALLHDYIPALAHPFCAVLATRPIGCNFLPDRLDHYASIPPAGYCGGWHISTSEINHPITGPDVASIKKCLYQFI
jgi:hypothetical protein